MLLLYAIPAGLLIGLLAGGRFDRLARVQIRWARFAVAGLVFQLVLFSPPVASLLASAGTLGPQLYVASTAVVLATLAANLSQPGFRVLFAGATLNLVAIIANGGYMPASPEAWAAAHGVTSLPAGVLTNSTLAGPNAAFAFLGDIFYLPQPLPFANVFSMGDALIAAGGVVFLAQTMAGRITNPLTQQYVQPRPVSG